MAGGYRYAVLNNESSKFLTYIIITFNIIFALMGALMFAILLNGVLNKDFRAFMQRADMDHFYKGVYILLAAGCLTIIQTFFGVVGAYQKKSSLLLVYSVCVIICIVLEIAGTTMLLVYGTTSETNAEWLQDKLYSLIIAKDYDLDSKDTIHKIQEWMRCCGANGINDYIKWNKPVPYSCFDPVTGNAWYKKDYGYVGCVTGFAWYVQPVTRWGGVIALLLAFFQLFTLGAALGLACMKKVYKSRSEANLAR